MSSKYDIEIKRDGRWWMIHIPELDGLTQARRLSEAELMGREWISVSTGTPINDVSVYIISITAPGIGNIQDIARKTKAIRETAWMAETAAQETMRRSAKTLTEAHIPVRDVAHILNVSPQRISQLNDVTP